MKKKHAAFMLRLTGELINSHILNKQKTPESLVFPSITCLINNFIESCALDFQNSLRSNMFANTFKNIESFH